MITHVIKVVTDATQLLNPEQVPVITMDQPFYALGKLIQWSHPELYGEDKLVMMLGPLHTEMAALKTIGDFMDGSGWTNAITKANIVQRVQLIL